MGKDIGIQGVEAPKESCTDRNCPFHGSLKVRGRIFKGSVVSDKMTKGIVLKFERIYKIPKYERFGRKIIKIKAHNPPCINAKIGDKVTVGECRRLSKTKSFVVLSKGEKA